MKSYITKIIFAVSLVMLAGLTATYAQMDSDSILKVKISNAFVVRDITYPAGDYTIKPVADSGCSNYLLELTGPGVNTAVFVTYGATRNEPRKNTELVFEKVGDEYFLSKIFVKGAAYGNEIGESKTERKMIAAGEPTEEYIVNEVRANLKKDRAR